MKFSQAFQFTLLIALMSLILSGCVGKPQPTKQRLQEKTALESVDIILSVIKTPLIYRSGMVLQDVTIDEMDPTTLVYHYQLNTPPPKGREDIKMTQKDIFTNINVKKSVIGACNSMYIYFDNGAKMRVKSEWEDGTPFADYVISKKTCDSFIRPM